MKSTEELMHEIENSRSFVDYLEGNAEEMQLHPFPECLDGWLKKKQLSRADVVRQSNLNKAYVYQIFSGRKYPSRDKVIALGFGLKLNIEEMPLLLKQAGYRTLYPRDTRDALLLFALKEGMNILDTNNLLYDHEVEVLE